MGISAQRGREILMIPAKGSLMDKIEVLLAMAYLAQVVKELGIG